MIVRRLLRAARAAEHQAWLDGHGVVFRWCAAYLGVVKALWEPMEKLRIR